MLSNQLDNIVRVSRLITQDQGLHEQNSLIAEAFSRSWQTWQRERADMTEGDRILNPDQVDVKASLESFGMFDFGFQFAKRIQGLGNMFVGVCGRHLNA